MYAHSSGEGIGVVPIAAVGAGISIVKNLFSGNTFKSSKQRDKDRAKKVDALYARALAGDDAATKEILMLSKSSATAPAKAYAAKKYQQLMAALAKQEGVPATTGSAPTQMASVLGGSTGMLVVGGLVVAGLLLAKRR